MAKVEVISKMTEAQLKDARMSDIEEKLDEQEKHILELRAQMIEIRKELAKVGKKDIPKTNKSS